MAVAPTNYLVGVLKRTGLFSDEQVAALQEKAKGRETSITQLVVGEGLAAEEPFLQAAGQGASPDFYPLGPQVIDKDVLPRLPTKAVFQYNVIPISVENGVLVVATNDPLNAGLLDTLRLAAETRVRLVLSTSDDIAKAAKKFYRRWR